MPKARGGLAVGLVALVALVASGNSSTASAKLDDITATSVAPSDVEIEISQPVDVEAVQDAACGLPVVAGRFYGSNRVIDGDRFAVVIPS